MAPTESAKITILTRIREEKAVLFGKFSKSLTKVDKDRQWKGIAAGAKALGVLNPTKEWTYLRDTIWQNWRKRAIEKLDNSRKTGTEGGEGRVPSEMDNIVYDIIGRDSAVLDGFDVPESSGSSSREIEEIPNSVHEREIRLVEEEENLRDRLMFGGSSTPPRRRLTSSIRPRNAERPTLPSNQQRKRKTSGHDEEFEKSQKEKLTEQTLALKLDNFKKHLDIYDTEFRLGLTQSKLVTDFLAEHYPS